MANKIVDLDRLKDYANKESVLLGKKVKDQVIFDGTASGFVADGSKPWKLGKLSGPLPIIEGEHYKVTIDGTVRADEECSEYDQGESCFYMADIGLAITSGGHVMDFTKARTTVNIKVEGMKRQIGTIDTLPNCNIVNGEGNFAVKTNNTFNDATGTFSVALGAGNIATGFGAVAEGIANDATGEYAHAEGYYNEASGNFSHAEGSETEATGEYTHAEGLRTAATFGCAHAEGFGSNASGESAHAEGNMTTASGACAHSEGAFTIASGDDSHAQGYLTTAASRLQSVRGAANVPDPDEKFADIIGMGDFEGTTVNHARNIEATTYDGNKFMLGDVYVGANEDSTGGQKLLRPSEMGTPVYDATAAYVTNQTIYEPTTDKFYKAKSALAAPAGDFDSTKWTEIKFGGGYLTKNNPDGTGSFGMNRKSSEALGNRAIAIGLDSKATKQDSIAIGRAASATSQDSIAFGKSATASAGDTLAFGTEATASTRYCTAIGYKANASGNCGVAIGVEATAPGAYGTAIGYHLTANGGHQMVRGRNNVVDTSPATYADILGWGDVTIEGSSVVAIGDPKNIEATTVTGDKRLKNEIYVHCNDDSSGGVNICDTVKVTKAELNQLITDKKLIPGLLYQITDYEYTCGQANVMPFSETTKYKADDIVTHDGKMWKYMYNFAGIPPIIPAVPDYAPNPGAWSTETASGASTPRWTEVTPTFGNAGKQFDIVLTAIAKDKLAADGSAVLHGTATSFTDYNGKTRDLTKWKVEYDVSKHRISYLVDENGNGAPYDHMNALFTRLATTDALGSLNGKYGTVRIGSTGMDPYYGSTETGDWVTGVKITAGTASKVTTFGTDCKDVVIDKCHAKSPINTDEELDIVIGNACDNIHISHGSYAGVSRVITIGNLCSGINITGSCRVALGDSCWEVEITGAEGVIARGATKGLTIDKNCSDIQLGIAANNVHIGSGCTKIELIGGGAGDIKNITIGTGCTDIYLKNHVRECTFMDNANSIWMDTSAIGATAFLRGFVFETGCTGWVEGGDGVALDKPLRISDGGFENNNYGTKHVFFSKNMPGTTTGFPIVSWYEGITLKGKYKNVSDQSSAGNWVTL